MFLAHQVKLQNFFADVARRAREEETGQTFVEWLGVMAVIVTLVAALTATGALDGVKGAITNVATSLINSVKGGS